MLSKDAGLESPIKTQPIPLQKPQSDPESNWFAGFMWYFNRLYFSESAAGLAYQNGQQFDYSSTDLLIYLPTMATWMLFASRAAQAQQAAEQHAIDDPSAHNPVMLMRCFIVFEAVIRGLKNVNWIATVAGETAVAHGAQGLGMMGASGLTQ